MSNNIGKRIADLRKEHNLSQQELADKLNVSNKTISKWECGNGTPDIDSLNKLSNIFNLTLDELVNYKQEIEKKEITKTVLENKEEHTKGLKKETLISSIVSTIIFVLVSISLLCYFFVPRNPQIDKSNTFDINQEALTGYCAVDNNTEIFSFYGTIETPRTTDWRVYYDLYGLREIKSKTVNLQIGNNIFYVVVENTAGEKKAYTINIRRKPLYVVTFNTLGGNTIINENVQEGNLVTYREPTKDGYIFNGWDYDFTQPITSNITITASWVAENLSINYFANNGTVASSTQRVTYDNLVTLKSENEFSLKGYTLSNWNTEADGSGISYSTSKIFSKYKIPENLDLYAQWTINQYQIIANKNLNNAGTVVGAGSYDYNSTQTISTTTNEGYTWVGWYSSNDVLISSSQSLSVTLEDKDIEYIAKWTANKYTLSLDVNNGDALAQTTKEVTFGESFILPITTRTEATFLGWYDINDKQYTNNQGVCLINWDKANNTTLYAHYKINQYELVLNKNIDKAGNVQGSGLKDYDSTVTITATTNNGYSFVGWFDGSNLISNNNQYSFTMSNYPITYSAKWRANDYTLTMNVNNGNSLENDVKDVTYDSSYTLPITNRDGYSFGGWYLGVNATGKQLTDSNGNSLTAWAIASDTQVYAKWNIVTYKLTFSLNEGNVVTENPTSYTIEDLDIKINNPIRNGYVFEGWIGTGITENTKDLIINAGSFGDKTFGAVWSKSSQFIAISTSDDLLNIKNNLHGYYYLTEDINMEGVEFTTLGDENTPFTGVIDGCGYTILNLKTESIFNTLNGFIYNLMFEKAVGGVGFIAKTNNGKITQCIINGKFKSSAITSVNNGEILNIAVKGSVGYTATATDSCFVVGVCSSNKGIIKNLYTELGIYANSNHNSASGYLICSSNDGIVENVFATGSISVRAATTGALNDYYDVSVRVISSNSEKGYINCFTSNQLYITTKKGPYNDENSYYYKNGASTENLQNLKFMKFGEFKSEEDLILNPDNVWVEVENDYPKLYWEVQR